LVEGVIDADPIAAAVRAMMATRAEWTGTASNLLAQFALAMHAGLTFSIPAAAARTARGEGVRGRTAR
jgi:hypothetical protein